MWAALVRLFGPFRAPPDGVAWAALGLAVLALALALRAPELLGEGSRRRFLTLSAAAAAMLSLGYAAIYLRGGPRIVDATTYWLQGRALAEGHVTFAVPEPSASFRGRFLYGAEPGRLAGIFPPGYPLLLALGFLIDAPMLVGPILAALLVFGTHRLVHALGRDVPGLANDDARRELAARGAVLFSIACAALRYHTADTMSHGAVAVFVLFALARALEARRRGDGGFLGVGLLVGMVLLTRLVSALPIGLVALALAWRGGARKDPKARRRGLVRLALGIAPAVGALLAWQHAVTGSAFVPAQSAYYATSDGPPGCFRWGFGDGIGCLYEHGDFVQARLANGYGPLAALGTTVRRLHVHLDDAFAGWPLTVALLVLVVLAIRRSSARAAFAVPAALIGLQIVAYLPFYFDGDYPGGGARFFADVLPVEHALVAVALAGPARSAARPLLVVLAGMLVLFATHGVFAHHLLADREGGAPMWDAARARDAGAEHGLVFVDTDHAFDLAFDPDAMASKKRTIARLRGDAHDRLLYERLGTPQSFIYRWDDGKATFGAWVPPLPSNAAGLESWRFEGESMWPPLAQDGAWAIPEWHSGGPDACASNGRVLRVRTQGHGTVRVEVPIPNAGTWAIIPRVVFFDDDPAPAGDSPTLTLAKRGAPITTWDVARTEGAPRGTICRELGPAIYVEGETGARPLTLDVHVTGSAPVALDSVLVERR